MNKLFEIDISETFLLYGKEEKKNDGHELTMLT